MSKIVQLLVSKLPSNAVNFVGRFNKFSKHKGYRRYKSLLFLRGLIDLFSSSMLAVFTNAKSASVFMAAIVLRLFWTLLCLLYMLHDNLNNNRLNTISISLLYENHFRAQSTIELLMNVISSELLWK